MAEKESTSQFELKTWFNEGQYGRILTSLPARILLGHEEGNQDFSGSWPEHIAKRFENLVEDSAPKLSLHRTYSIIGDAALYAFLQSNVTGPPLPFKSEALVFTKSISENAEALQKHRQDMIRGLSIDGEAAYSLIPNVELFCLAKCILTNKEIVPGHDESLSLRRRIHLNFLHQRLLSENTDSIQSSIYADLARLEELTRSLDDQEDTVKLLLERASIHTTYGFDAKARADLERAAKKTDFTFALTGRMGKRTKFQDRDISQLVVLARSSEQENKSEQSTQGSTPNGASMTESSGSTTEPLNLDLNNDTLLESIYFAKEQAFSTSEFTDEDRLPTTLASLDPSNQPKLNPLDSIILLSWASSISNTSPQDGLTREETVPYATRVLDGGSSNWQIYTQALLIRSRVEGYRSRTIERGVLQLQALVDQVIAETSGSDQKGSSETGTFLPRATQSESAPVTERLRYIWALNSPTRWELEAELAARWVSLGGLRTALEIYERLEMWAEVALCWAATEREDNARSVVRTQLFISAEDSSSSEKHLLPADAPRLYCILGDIDKEPSHYARAWEISNHRYARAQRALGRHYVTMKDYSKAAEAYAWSLKINRLNHSTWFALGCVQLELENWPGAVESFTRTVQLDDTDAEAWSNLAAALLRLPELNAPNAETRLILDDEEPSPSPSQINPGSNPEIQSQKHKRDALAALSRASRLKPTSAQIWDNLLTVSLSLTPPPYSTIISTLSRIIAIRGPRAGESAIDVSVLAALVTRIITIDDPSSSLTRSLIRLVDSNVVPLITHRANLWRQVARLALWRGKNLSSMEAYEKAWRAATAKAGWETGTEGEWDAVVEATVELVDAYESLGMKERGEGLGGEEVVARDWRFKGRSAIRGVMGRAKGIWEGTEGWERLRRRLEDLKGS